MAFVFVWGSFSCASADQSADNSVVNSADKSADQSIGFRYYFDEGLKAFKQHDDADAVSFFKIAQTYNPFDQELNRYLTILGQKGIVFESPLSQFSQRDIEVYRYYFGEAMKALWRHDDKKAIRYFKIAKIFNPASTDVDWYLAVLYQRLGAVEIPKAVPVPAARAVPVLPLEAPVSTQQPGAAVSSQPTAVSVPLTNSKNPPIVIKLSQFPNSEQAKPQLTIERKSSVIIEGEGIQRFLIVDEWFKDVKLLDPNHLEIDAQTISETFLHIWDSTGRHTFFVKVIFPKIVNTGVMMAGPMPTEHGEPFRATYTNDWISYYTGKNSSSLKRLTHYFNETFGLRGDTPYGFLDTSGSYSDFNGFSQFDTYTLGLSQIPLEGTSNFNLRFFDAPRSLSALTLPGTTLRGWFGDVNVLDDKLGLSVGHGEQQLTSGFLFMGQSPITTYIDELKLTLFPTSIKDQYSFNFATSYGTGRPSYLTNHVFSLEGQHRFTDSLNFYAEHGTDTVHGANAASLTWRPDTHFMSALNVRNISQNYTTIVSLPAYQGETGVSWTTEGLFKNIEEDSFFDVYKSRLNAKPDSSGSLDYNGNVHVRVNVTPVVWSDTNVNFLDTEADIAAQRNAQINQQFSRSFDIWNSLKATAFAGAGSAYSHSKDNKTYNYTRKDVTVGFNVPLTQTLNTFARYEYDWVDQPRLSGNSNPSNVNAGLSYSKMFRTRFSINGQVSYQDDLGAKPNNSFTSGQQSVMFSGSISYSPNTNISIFADTTASKVTSHLGLEGYDSFQFHIGMRLAFGGTTYWDPIGYVAGIVFLDRKSNGKFGAGDEGIAGVKIKVGDHETTTDKNGRYRIRIRAKNVNVGPVLNTLPGGLMFSTPETRRVRIFQGRTAKADFGLTSQTGIYGLVFISKGGSGIPIDTDKFVSGVRVILDGHSIQKTDPNGAFYFRNLAPGTHTIAIDINSIPLDMVPLIKLVNRIDVPESINYNFNIPLQNKKAQEDK